MKKQITLLGFSVLMIAAVPFTAATAQQEKNKNKKEQQKNQGKKQDKAARAGKVSSGRNDNNGQHEGKKDQQDKQGKFTVRENTGKNPENGHERKTDDISDNRDMKDGYKWDRATFKNRKKYKNQEKVLICHKFNKDTEPAVTINVSSHALKAHMNHGDVMGACPAVTNSHYSNIFLRNRTDYYNNLQNYYEQVSYSRSILDYALVRLTNSRKQLVTLQNNKMPLKDIQDKQTTVVELEQNVSLLETLIAVAANLVVDKLQ